MFWAYKPPSFTSPTMPLDTLSTMFARRLKVVLLGTKKPIS